MDSDIDMSYVNYQHNLTGIPMITQLDLFKFAQSSEVVKILKKYGLYIPKGKENEKIQSQQK